jgi:hypothetical protein
MRTERFDSEREFYRVKNAILTLGELATTGAGQEAVHQIVQAFDAQTQELVQAHEQNKELLDWLNDNLTKGGAKNGDRND